MNTETTTKTDLKIVIFRLPSHIADLINETREHIPGLWEEHIESFAHLDRTSFESCRREFEYIAVDGQLEFDNAEERARFAAPMIAALRKAYDQHASIAAVGVQ